MNQSEPEGTGARVLLTMAGAVIVIAGIKAASSLILPLLVAVFLAMISLPLLNWLLDKRVPTALAVPVRMARRSALDQTFSSSAMLTRADTPEL